jgi:integrase
MRLSVARALCIPEQLQLAAWFTASFSALWRASEAASLRWQDVQWSASVKPGKVPQEAVMTLAARDEQVFKTHKNSVVFRIPGNGSATCVITHLYTWWRFCKSPVEGEVFPLGMEVARKELQKAAAAVTKQPQSAFGLHSLRSGGATHMETIGKPMSESWRWGDGSHLQCCCTCAEARRWQGRWGAGSP